MATEKKKPMFDDTAGKLKGKKAKKDYHIFQNHIDITIKAGDELDKIPNRFEPTLKVEGVI